MAPDDKDFRIVLDRLTSVEGWLSEDQARRLWCCARQLPGRARIVEIGSFRGRSTIVLGLAAPADAVVYAIDPHAGSDRGPREIRPNSKIGERDAVAFRANLMTAGVADRVQHVRLQSTEALDVVHGTVDLLYVDGAHDYGAARRDVESWGSRVNSDGIMLIHDGFSSVGVTLAVLRLLVGGRRFAYRGRTGSLLEYRRSDVSGRERFANAIRQLAELPWFTRNLAIKLAIVVRGRPLLRLLRHRSGEWPY